MLANVSASPAYRLDISGTRGGGGDPDLGESHGRGASEGARSAPLRVTFSYSVSWHESAVAYEGRMEAYSQSNFLPATLEIHWLSIINSLVLVMLLTAFLAIILMRVIRNDFTRYMRADEDEEAGDGEETGWKLIHGDVFRPPVSLSLFTALVGSGAHLFVMTLLLLTLAVGGFFSLARRGSIVAACILLYVVTAFVGGFVTARLYKKLKGTAWVWNVMLNLAIFPAPLLGTFSILNTTAIAKASTAALPMGTMLIVGLLFVFVAFPLTVLGGIAGKNSRDYEAPCRTSKVARQVPAVPWYRSALAQLFMAGFLPFSAISIELHYIFASVWGHKVRGAQAWARQVPPDLPPLFCLRTQHARCSTTPPPLAGVHAVRHPLPGLCAAHHCDVLHRHCPHVLSAGGGGPQVVVALAAVWRLGGPLHLRLLLLLLL